jgi:hypothetical protein
VADDQHGALLQLDPLLEPLDAGEVEVVGRFVEQQQLGARHERLGEAGAAALASRKRVHVALPEALVQADARQHLLDAALAIEAAQRLDLVQQRVVAFQFALQRLAVQLAEALAALLVLAQRRAQLDQPGLDELAHRGRPGDLGALLHVAHAHALPQGHAAPVGLLLADEQAQDGRLAAAVAADQAELLPRVDAEAGAGEHLVRAKVLLHAVEDGQGHGAKRIPAGRRLRSAPAARKVRNFFPRVRRREFDVNSYK